MSSEEPRLRALDEEARLSTQKYSEDVTEHDLRTFEYLQGKFSTLAP